MEQVRVVIDAFGRVSRPGVETPKGATVVAEARDTVVVKIPGHSYWVGIGVDRGYQAAEFVVYDIVYGPNFFEDGRRSFVCRERVRFPVRS